MPKAKLTKEQIDQKHLEQVNQLEAEYFIIVDKGLPTQHRELKEGKTMEEFNLAHGQIWKSHQAELVAGGHMKDPLAE